MCSRTMAVFALLFALAAPCFAQETFDFVGTVVKGDLRALEMVGGAQVYAVLTPDDPLADATVQATATTLASGTFIFRGLPKPRQDQSYYYVAFSKDTYLGYSSESRMIRIASVGKQDLYVVDISRKVVERARVDFTIATDLKGKGGSINTMPSSVICAVMGTKPGLTDADGKYTFTQLPEGTVMQPNVTKPGYYQAGAGGQPLTAFLDPAGVLAGRVVDDKGKGIPRVGVHGFFYGKKDVVLWTDDQGKFSGDVPPATYTLLLRDNPSLTAPAIKDVTVAVNKTTTVPDAVAGPGEVVSGRIVNSRTDQPVDMSAVYVVPPGWPDNLGTNYRTDKTGRFEFRSAPGDIKLSAGSLKGGYAPYNQTLSVKPGGVTNLAIRLVPDAPASGDPEAGGRVIDSEGKPVAGASVVLDDLRSRTVKTDSEGRFSSRLLPEGKTNTAGHVLGKTLVEVEEPTRKIGYVGAADREAALKGDVVVTAVPAKPFTVIVRDTHGKPIKDAEVKTLRWYADAGGPVQGGKTDAHGKLVLDTLYADAAYTFEATAEGYYSEPFTLSEEVRMSERSERSSITLELEAANRTQKGKVVDAQGKPIAGAAVGTKAGRMARTDEAGEFTLTGLPDQDVEVYCVGQKVISSKNTPYLTIRLGDEPQ